MSDLRHFKVGDKCFTFDTNRRVYRDRSMGGGGVIFAQHFIPSIIVGETRASWIVEMADDAWEPLGKFTHHKFKKDGSTETEYGLSGWLYTDAERIDAIWKNENGPRIYAAVPRASAKTLRAIDALLSQEAT